MNPRWIVVRPRPTEIGPLTRGAVPVASYGLHLRRPGPGLWRVALAKPDNTVSAFEAVDGALTLSLLDVLAALRAKRGVWMVVWVHGLAELVPVLFGAFAEALAVSTEPVIRWDGPRQPSGPGEGAAPQDSLTVRWDGALDTGDGIAIVSQQQSLSQSLIQSLTRWDMPPFRISLLAGRVGAATISFEGRRTVRLIDSQAYLGAELGDRSTRGLVAHAVRAAAEGVRSMHPAAMTRVVGERIADVWTVCDVPPAPTPSATGAKLFQRSYLRGTLSRMPYHVESAAELAFHGGKIGLWVPTKTRQYVHVYDLRSAYAWAMTQIPPFYAGEWVRFKPTITSKQNSDTFTLGIGFSRVTGSVKCCRWPVIPSHCGEWISNSKVKRTWVTNYELTEAVNSGELEVYDCVSWVWIENAESETESSPWKRFSEEVFRRRDVSTDAIRSVYKGALVGLYGKTVQRSLIPPVMPAGVALRHGIGLAYCGRDGVDADQPSYFRAGGVYYPVVGSLVTGCVRARMHAAEHRYQATHSAVDALHTTVPIEDDLIGPGLGQWRYVGEGVATYEAANRYRIVGPNGFVKRAQSGVPMPIGTLDDAEEM